MMIRIEKDPAIVIKYYPVKVFLHTTYEVFLVHNETTGEITMTSVGMSVDSFNRCFKSVEELFIKQMGLNADGKKP